MHEAQARVHDVVVEEQALATGGLNEGFPFAEAEREHAARLKDAEDAHEPLFNPIALGHGPGLFFHRHVGRQIRKRSAFAFGPCLGMRSDPGGLLEKKRFEVTEADIVMIKEPRHGVAVLQWQIASEDDAIEAAQHTLEPWPDAPRGSLSWLIPLIIAKVSPILVAAEAPRWKIKHPFRRQEKYCWLGSCQRRESSARNRGLFRPIIGPGCQISRPFGVSRERGPRRVVGSGRCPNRTGRGYRIRIRLLWSRARARDREAADLPGMGNPRKDGLHIKASLHPFNHPAGRVEPFLK